MLITRISIATGIVRTQDVPISKLQYILWLRKIKIPFIKTPHLTQSQELFLRVGMTNEEWNDLDQAKLGYTPENIARNPKLLTDKTFNMLVTKISEFSHIKRTQDIPVTIEQLKLWQNGMPIQEAMPDLTPSQRLFIKTGMTDEEWDVAFPPEEDEKDDTDQYEIEDEDKDKPRT